MRFFGQSPLLLLFIWSCIFFQRCSSDTFALPAILPTFPSSLQLFIGRLWEGQDTVLPRQYHSAWDLSTSRAHHWLTNYLFKGGKDYNPSLLYLGRDPAEPGKHLAVAHFLPGPRLLNRVRPVGAHGFDYEYRHGLLAMKLTSHEEPDFIGILWIKDRRIGLKMYRAIQTNSLNSLERAVPGLKDVQRVIHYRIV